VIVAWPPSPPVAIENDAAGLLPLIASFSTLRHSMEAYEPGRIRIVDFFGGEEWMEGIRK